MPGNVKFLQGIAIGISNKLMEPVTILSDSNGIRTHNHLVCEWTLNHLAKEGEFG